MLGILGGTGIAGFLAITKLFNNTHIMLDHGPLLIFAAVLILAGGQLLGLGLLGEMNVRHYHDAVGDAPYAVEQVLQSHDSQSTMAD
jgi:hypothetical protein